jgi:hypothetical protein
MSGPAVPPARQLGPPPRAMFNNIFLQYVSLPPGMGHPVGCWTSCQQEPANRSCILQTDSPSPSSSCSGDPLPGGETTGYFCLAVPRVGDMIFPHFLSKQELFVLPG